MADDTGARTPASLREIASCVSGYDPAALRIEAAQDFIARLVTPVETVEKLALRSALGRVLAHDVVSGIDVPGHDNSAMDGYALRGADLAGEGKGESTGGGDGGGSGDVDRVFEVVGSDLLAGQAFEGEVGPGQCVRIMTGAPMPAGLDTVVPQEFVVAGPGGNGGGSGSGGDNGNGNGGRERITVPAGAVRPGDNRRLAGEDLAVGEVALAAGRVLRPADLGLLASLGRAEVPVRRRVRVAFFSTGDELRSLGEPLDAGCVYDSNRYTLWAMLERLGVVEPIDMGVVRDEPAALAEAFRAAAGAADAVITSGGVSVGEADHTKRVMAELGDVLFWRVAMRPGRPLAIGRIEEGGQRSGEDEATGGNGKNSVRDQNQGQGRNQDRGGGWSRKPGAILFGLPGNPVAVMVTFYALVRDALLAMAGASPRPLPLLRAASAAPIRKKPGRTEYQRAIVEHGADGQWQVHITGSQGSGILRSMSEANGLIVLHHSQGNVAAGEVVDVLPFEGLI